eukprot:TRINITY_DN3260_c0_g1_i1.p1 TRINITY_DN3260_c0_g1~~TRINITY_DN3260_c0_g1_i1.p1  ORF type:complete len:1491 (-),score=373.27 TRINITY_DN3260_c0_g1_i1:58-4530(-)
MSKRPEESAARPKAATGMRDSTFKASSVGTLRSQSVRSNSLHAEQSGSPLPANSSPPPTRGAAMSGSSGDQFVPREASSVSSQAAPATAKAAQRKDITPSTTQVRRRSPTREDIGRPGSSAASSVPPPPLLQQQAPQPPRSPQRRKAQEERESAGFQQQPLASAPLLGVAPPPGLTRPQEEVSFTPPPGLGLPDLFSVMRRSNLLEASMAGGFETDSFDEEVELLRCEKDLVEAAVELGTTTSADEFTTDADLDEEDDGALWPVTSSRGFRSSVASVVIEEDDEEAFSEGGGQAERFQVDDGSEVRSRLWAQSLLRMRRSIDEIYVLCEFESDESLCEQVGGILKAASKDFDDLLKQFESQQEYTLLGGEYPFKSGVAWTTRTPRTSRGVETMLEQLEKAQSGSPANSSTGRSSKAAAESAQRERLLPSRKRPTSAEPRCRTSWLEDSQEVEEAAQSQASSTGDLHLAEDRRDEASSSGRGGREGGRSNELYFMVQSALENVHKRLGQTHRPSPQELQNRHEARMMRAQHRRAMQDDQRMMQLRLAESRAHAARERRQEQEQRRQQDLLEKMTRARRQYQDQLRAICQRARKENRKANEVAFLAKEAIKSENEILKQKHENARESRKSMREQMRSKLVESAKRVAKVSETRRRQLELWQEKISQDLAEKERLASERRQEHMKSIKLKSQGQETRSEIVQKKRRELQVVDERCTKDFLHFRSKNIGRMALDCDGLPEAVREEVVASSSAAPSSAGASKPRRKASSSGATRATTPPPTQATTPKSSPPPEASSASAVVMEPGYGHEQHDEAPVPTFPVLPEVPRLPGGAEGTPSSSADAPGETAEAAAESSSSPVPPEVKAGPRKGSTTSPSSAGSKARTAAARSAVPGSSSVRGGQIGDSPAGISAAPEAGDASATAPDAAEPLQEVTGLPSGSQQGQGSSARAICLEQLRQALETAALGDEEALHIACDSDVSKAAASNTAQRARISKLALELGKVVGGLSSSVSSAGSADDVQPASILNLERTEAILGDFCKILGQMQREADYMLILKLGCARLVVDICSRVKDSIGSLVIAGDKAPVAAWKQNCNVMLSALKWLGLLCKHKMSRVFLLLTGRMVVLADVASACLDMHFADALKPQDVQGGPVLFLPQLLHVLALHTKQALPESAGQMQVTLAGFLLLCGLAEKLRDLFGRAEIRGLKLFDGASPVPLLLLRAMGFLGTLVNSFRMPSTPAPESTETHACVLGMLQQTELFGIVSILVSILLSEGRLQKGAKLPQTVISLSVQAVRILNNIARTDLHTLQKTLGTGIGRQQELYHLLVSLLDYCTARVPASVTKPSQSSASAGQAEESDLLHETVILLGFYCLQAPHHQTILCYGEGQALLARLASLPLHYFMDDKGRAILFPTILAVCFKSEQNLEMLRNEMNLSLLQNFLSAQLALREDMRSAEISVRFPPSLWQDAFDFFDGAAGAQSTGSSLAEVEPAKAALAEA